MTDQEEKAVCACLEVVYKAIANENGAMTEAWWCRRCNTRFVRQFWLQEVHEEAYKEGRADMQEEAAKAVINSLLSKTVADLIVQSILAIK